MRNGLALQRSIRLVVRNWDQLGRSRVLHRLLFRGRMDESEQSGELKMGFGWADRWEGNAKGEEGTGVEV